MPTISTCSLAVAFYPLGSEADVIVWNGFDPLETIHISENAWKGWATFYDFVNYNFDFKMVLFDGMINYIKRWEVFFVFYEGKVTVLPKKLFFPVLNSKRVLLLGGASRI